MTTHARAAIDKTDPPFIDRDDVVRTQIAKLAALGRRLADDPQWRAHFRRDGLSPRDLADPAALNALTILGKDDLHTRYPFPFLSQKMDAVSRFFATSGTTGLPVLFGFTARDLERLGDQMLRVLKTCGARPGDRAYQGYGYGTWIGGPAFDIGLARLGATTFPIGPGRGELVARWLVDHAYTLCSMSPLWMMTLLTIAREQGIDPKRDWTMRVGIFGGQSVSQAFKTELQRQLPDGFEAHNVYGTTEAGGPILGISCPHSLERDEMHLINDDSVMAEILDPDTRRPVGPGELGEIVITTLDKEASPVVRWGTRDLVRLSDKPYDCPCGRHGYPLIGRIVGRSDDMLKVRGVIVYPTQIEDVIAGVPGAMKEAWQIYIDRDRGMLEELVVAVERRNGANQSIEEVRDAVADGIRNRLGIRALVECHGQGALPRYEAKAVRVLTRGPDTG